MIKLNPKNYDGLDILCRVYENQSEEYWKDEKERDEKSQICAEVLFSNTSGIDKDHQRCTCWLPRGAANFIVQEIKEFKGQGKVIGICNELSDSIGVLTSCRENFENSLRKELAELDK